MTSSRPDACASRQAQPPRPSTDKPTDRAARERAFYEVEHNWAHFTFTETMEGKLRQLRDLLPPEVGSVCDLGCGNGLLTNRLADPTGWVGVDWSLTALRAVGVPRVCASAGQLPFRSGQFDLILSSELLEHLTQDVYAQTTAEIERLAPRYLLLSVPNDENIHINEVRCRRCGDIFNASHHYRRFSTSSLAAGFPSYRLLRSRVGGPPRRAYPLWLLRLRQRLGRRYFQVPASRRVVCPRCGNQDFPGRGHNPLSLACDGVNCLISRRRPYWLYLLLERRATLPGA